MLYHCVMIYYGIPGGTMVKNLPANTGGTGDASLTPGLGKSPRVGYVCQDQSCISSHPHFPPWYAYVWITITTDP